MERKNAVERNGAADAASLGLCGGRGLTRCGATEEALAWGWCSGGGLHEVKRSERRCSETRLKTGLLEGRNTEKGRALIGCGSARGIGGAWCEVQRSTEAIAKPQKA